MANTLFNSMKQKYGKWIGEMDTNSGIKIVGWFEGQNPRTDKVKEFKTFAEAKKWGATRDAQSVMDKAIRMMDSVKVFNTEKEAKEYIQKLNKEQNRKNIFSNIELRKENGKFKVIDKASDAVKGYGSFFQPSDFSKTSKKDLLDAYKKAREEYLKDIKNQTKFRAFKDAERACKMYGIRV